MLYEIKIWKIIIVKIRNVKYKIIRAYKIEIWEKKIGIKLSSTKYKITWIYKIGIERIKSIKIEDKKEKEKRKIKMLVEWVLTKWVDQTRTQQRQAQHNISKIIRNSQITK